MGLSLFPLAAQPSRRALLQRAAGGFAAIALRALLSETAATAATASDPLAPRPPHFAAKAKRVIFLFMTGGVSHVDSFDPKPNLIKDHGKTVALNEWQGRPGRFNRFLKRPDWAFRPRGRSGIGASGGRGLRCVQLL